jgi:hypothetical protein
MARHAQQPPLDALARQFERFARQESCNSSPLYARLSSGIAADTAMLALAAYARAGQPVPNLFLAAVHFLLLKRTHHPLSAFYPSVCGTSRSETTCRREDPYPIFRSFCLQYSGEIRDLVSTRLVQTNEVQRSACLVPAFARVVRHAQGRPLALIDIGASAGLNLLWDHYGYDYGHGACYGDARSPVRIACTVRGDRRPPIPALLPAAAWRVGLDLSPVDVRDPEAALWLRALVWPEHARRVALLQCAIEVARRPPPSLMAGDALDLLPAVLPTVPRDVTLCVFHTFTVNQFSAEACDRLSSLLAEHSARRDLYRVSIEYAGQEFPRLRLVSFEGGVATEQLLARCGGHGEWIEWLAADTGPSTA